MQCSSKAKDAVSLDSRLGENQLVDSEMSEAFHVDDDDASCCYTNMLSKVTMRSTGLSCLHYSRCSYGVSDLHVCGSSGLWRASRVGPARDRADGAGGGGSDDSENNKLTT